MKQNRRSIVFSANTGAFTIALIAIGMGTWFFLNHHESSPVSEALAQTEFSRLRSRFSTQQPLIEMGVRQSADLPAIGQPVTPIHTFHTVIFDTRGSERIVRVTVPYWFARLFANHDGEFSGLCQLTFPDDTEFDGEAIHLSLEQLEQRGPGLIVDFQHQSSGQFMSWVEGRDEKH